MKKSYQITDQVDLRYLNLDHAEELCKLIDTNRNYLNKYLHWPRVSKTVEDSNWFINRTIENREKDIHVFGIFFENKLVGVVGFNDYSKANKTAPIGYWLAENYQGKGLITNSVKFLLKFGFEELDLNRIEIACATSNIASEKVALRLGFTFEGIARQVEIVGDTIYDHKRFSILKSEWEN